MLRVLNCTQPENKRELFSNFDCTHETWVVSDLQSKWHLQKDLLKRNGVLQQASVMRATELWRQLAFQVSPDLQLLSPELAQTLLWNWIEPMNLPWAKSPQAVQVVLNQMQMWMSLLCDPRHTDVMPEWFQDNPESYVRWGHWFELCSNLWERCQSEGLVMVNWLPAVLLSQDLSEIQWRRPLTFDLGPQISQVEGLLIKELSRFHEVNLVYPEAAWISLMPNTLKPYESLLEAPYRGDTAWQPSVKSQIEFGRFSTQLAEVKDAVARIRQWLDRGIPADKIALVAPDIETYWPALKIFFDQEGIRCAKPATTRLGSFLEMAQWASSLRTALAKVNGSDLEVFLFSQRQKPKLSVDDFRVLFTHVYDAFDLGRARHLFEVGSLDLPKAPLLWSDFFGWALSFWDADADTSRLVALAQASGQEVPDDLKLTPLQWLNYIEGLLSRREVTLSGADALGIWCVSLSSADWLDVTHGIFLNLSEGALRRLESSPVSATDVQKIFTDTGYAVGTTDHQEHEFELLWFLNRNWIELRLCFAGTDFEGRVLTPSKLWMWAAFTNEKLKHHAEAPLKTRFDEIQAEPLHSLAALRQWNEVRLQGLDTALSREVSAEVSTWHASLEERLSASSLERYWRCPFIFAAEKKLKLKDEPALDLDLDRRTRGSLLHALAEALAEEPLRFDLSDEELTNLVDSVRLKENVQLGDERLWPVQRAEHVRLSRYFLEFEKEWRQRFPKTETVGRELSFQCHWGETGPIRIEDPKVEKLTTTPTVLFSGRMDRVDRDTQGRYALIDYKASLGGRNWKSWLDGHEIQLALYSMLLEEGLGGLDSGRVVAANYYVIKKSDRRKGFHLKDDTSELYSSQDRHMNFILEEDKQELFLKLREKINQAVKAILSGKLNPQPEDLSLCPACNWRRLCRAPHLN